MNIGSLFLSLGIKGDTKSLNDAIKKVEELKKQTQELNKALKETKANSKLNISTTSSGAKTPKESALLREEAAVSAARLRIAKTELGFVNLEEKAKTKQEKEQKKREKDREKATKDFFNQIENGFSFIAKAFTGGLLAGGVGGYITSQAAKQVSLAASLKQYGIDPETSQRYANVFRRASGGQIGVEETNDFLVKLSNRISRGHGLHPEELLPFSLIGVDPSKLKDAPSAIEEIRKYSKDPRYKQENLTALLDELGISREFAPAFGKDFSDQEFQDAYKNAKILTNEQVEAARKLNIKFSELGAAFDQLKGTLLEKFSPAIINIVNKIESKLNPENAEKAADIATGLGAGYVATKAVKTALRYGKAGLGRLGAVGIGGFGLYKGLSYLADENERLYFPEKYKKRTEEEKLKKDEYIADFGKDGGYINLRDPNEKISPEEIKEAIRQTTISPTNNVNTTVNINAASVDKNTAPYIADQINNNVNIKLNSKYPTLSVPK